jgi:hypothetical protein
MKRDGAGRGKGGGRKAAFRRRSGHRRADAP